LIYISKYYPRNYVFEKIADIYMSKKDYENAKKYYIKSIFHTKEEDKKQEIKSKLFDLILKKTKK
jgi:hypothetical protein